MTSLHAAIRKTKGAQSGRVIATSTTSSARCAVSQGRAVRERPEWIAKLCKGAVWPAMVVFCGSPNPHLRTPDMGFLRSCYMPRLNLQGLQARIEKEKTKAANLVAARGPIPAEMKGLLCPFAPARQVVFLLDGQPVDLDAHGLELHLGDLFIKRFRHRIDLFLERGVILHHVLGGQRLVGETHIHHRGRVPF